MGNGYINFLKFDIKMNSQKNGAKMNNYVII